MLIRLFAQAEKPFRSAHRFRHVHAVCSLPRAGTMADDKAFSENMMHAGIRTTDDTCDLPSSEEVNKRIAGLFSKSDVQERSSTGLEDIPDEKLLEILMEAAKRLAKGFQGLDFADPSRGLLSS